MNVKKTFAVAGCILSVATCIWYNFEKTQRENGAVPSIIIPQEELHADLSDDDSVLLSGVTAVDDEDGDLTDQLCIEYIEKAKEGSKKEFIVHYVVEDSIGNLVQAERHFFYDNYRQPHFLLNSALRFPLDEAINWNNLITVSDKVDGDISYRLQVEEDENLTNNNYGVGTYECVLSVTNSLYHEVSLPVTLEIYENTYEETIRPKIFLSKNIIYVKKGKSFAWKKNITYVRDLVDYMIDYGEYVQWTDEKGIEHIETQADYDGKPGNWLNISEIKFTTDADFQTEGIYSGTYTYTSSSTNMVGETQVIIIVE